MEEVQVDTAQAKAALKAGLISSLAMDLEDYIENGQWEKARAALNLIADFEADTYNVVMELQKQRG